MRPLQRLITASFALLAAAAPTRSFATPNFPGAVQTELALSYAPPCTICHNGTPGIGTVTQPFGIAMRSRGLQPNDTGSLSTAIKALDAENTDSDCDGTPDTDQLKAGHDPNTGLAIDGSDGPATASEGCGDTPEIPAYGCGAQIAAAPDLGWHGAAAVSAVLGLSLARRRRRRA